MTQISEAHTEWRGNIEDGSGRMTLGSGQFSGSFSKNSRFGEATGTNPEELIAAAQAGCYAMALAGHLASEGLTPSAIETTARVHLNMKGDTPHISTIDIVATAHLDDVKDEHFQQIAEAAKAHCPVANLCAGAQIRLEASHTA